MQNILYLKLFNSYNYNLQIFFLLIFNSTRQQEPLVIEI